MSMEIIMSKNTTKVRKGVGRKIQPKQFESLEISVAYEDVINWDTVEERQEKLDKISELAIIDFEKTFDRVCEELKVTPKTAAITHKSEDGSVKTATAQTSNDTKPASNMTDKDLDDFFDGV